MSIRTLPPKGTCYFFTITKCNWLPLFEATAFHDKIYSWFDFMKQRGDEIIGYCIMPNHLYGVLWLNNESPEINKVIGEARRLMSYSIVSRLKKKNETILLTKLQDAVSDYEIGKGLKHKVFEDSFDGKECYTYHFIQQKLHYMDSNPVKAGIVVLPEEYAHSSALFYETGSQGIYPVKYYADIYEEI